jgi:hypothetical protein
MSSTMFLVLTIFLDHPWKKNTLSSSCGVYLPFVCAHSLFNKVRVCYILFSLGRRSRFFLSSSLLLSLHLLTCVGNGGVVNIINVHSWFANFAYCLLHAITRKLLLCIETLCSCQLTSGVWQCAHYIYCFEL